MPKKKDPLKVALKVEKANLRAAVARVDAAAARRHMEKIQSIKARIKGHASSPDRFYDPADAALAASKAALKAYRKSRDVLDKAAAYRAPETTKASDSELDEVRYLRRVLDERDLEGRRAALQKLQALLSADELADVLMTRDPDRLVRKGGPNPRERAGEETVGRMVADLQSPATSPADRAEIMDRLVKAADGDEKATDALARIMVEKVAR